MNTLLETLIEMEGLVRTLEVRDDAEVLAMLRERSTQAAALINEIYPNAVVEIEVVAPLSSPEPELEPAKAPESEPEPETTSEPEPQPEPNPAPEAAPTPEPELSHDLEHQTIPEVEPEPEDTVTLEEVMQEPEVVRELRPLLTLNDKFRYKRLLFHGDNEALQAALDAMSVAPTVQAAIDILSRASGMPVDNADIVEFGQIIAPAWQA